MNYNETEKSNVINLLNYASEWLYSPIDEDLENKLYFMNLDNIKDEDLGLLDKIKEKVSSKDKLKDSKIIDIEDYFKDKLYDLLNKDLENDDLDSNKNKNRDIKEKKSILSRKYGLLINDKI